MGSAAGGDACGTHREESVAVIGLSDAAARELGRLFGQDAIFAWTQTPGVFWRATARLWLQADGPRARAAGFHRFPQGVTPSATARRPRRSGTSAEADIRRR
ncbi:DUF3293 domain-containing protein [Streptomyces sp. NPDC048191]|uniref:DUF3293 domain-containing protein n=1 Tax=Streptomyces sp. NPDC048191 TaxID=3155484 RepID=UPI0033E23266